MRSKAVKSCLVLVCAAVIIGFNCDAIEAEDCGKARELYATGMKMTDYVNRSQAFKKAVDLCPSYAEAHVNLADAYENLAKSMKDDPKKFNYLLDRAVEEYSLAVKINKELFPAHLGLGDTFRVMGLYEQSERSYERALQLRPDHPKAAAGLEKIRLINAQDKGGFRTSQEILKHVASSSNDSALGNLMGFEGHTVIKDRVAFNNLLFNEWSMELDRQETIQQLDEVGKALSSQELASCSFVVEGHTDDRGGEERNMRLSWNRCDSVKNYLTSRFGIPVDRITTQGFGYSRPRVPNDTTENMQKNRRVEILFVERSDK
jgi:outer membrane protein OmpA-like peptidoglycan-associated protein